MSAHDPLNARPSLSDGRYGPGCERHKGDPHNLCPECWKLEPDPSEVEIVNLSLDAYMDNGGR